MKLSTLLGVALTFVALACAVSRAKRPPPPSSEAGTQAHSAVEYRSAASEDGKAIFSVALHGSLSGTGRTIEITTARVTDHGFAELDQTTRPDSAWDPKISLRAGPYRATVTNTTGSWTSVTNASQVQISFDP